MNALTKVLFQWKKLVKFCSVLKNFDAISSLVVLIVNIFRLKSTVVLHSYSEESGDLLNKLK